MAADCLLRPVGLDRWRQTATNGVRRRHLARSCWCEPHLARGIAVAGWVVVVVGQRAPDGH